MLFIFRIQQKGEHYLNLSDNLINVFLNLTFNYYSQNTYLPQASFIIYDFIVKLSKYLLIKLINIYYAPNIYLKCCASLGWRYKMFTIFFIPDQGSSKHNICTCDSKAKRKEKIIEIKLFKLRKPEYWQIYSHDATQVTGTVVRIRGKRIWSHVLKS